MYSYVFRHNYFKFGISCSSTLYMSRCSVDFELGSIFLSYRTLRAEKLDVALVYMPLRVSVSKRLFSLLYSYVRMSSAITISNLAFLVLRLCTFGSVRSTSSLQELSGLSVRSHRENRMVNDNQTAILLLSLLNFLCVESKPFWQLFSKIMLFLSHE